MKSIARILTSVLALGAIPAVTAQTPSVVTGSVTYRERMALPPTAFLEVRLDDVSRPGVIPPVISTTMIERAAQVPIRFELRYDPQKIDANGRYAVRAVIKDGNTVLFSSQDTVLVLTQGHGTRADLVVSRVAAVPAAPPAAVPPAPPLPANPLMDLPATFVGTIPCADCEGIRMQLNLFPDDSYFVRMTYLGRPVLPADDLGSWALSSDRRVLILKGRGESLEMFAAGKPGTLRKLDAAGKPIESKLPYELTRTSDFRPLAVHGPMRGAYHSTDDATSFIECSTGQLWTVGVDTGAAADLKAAYLKTKPVDGAQVIAEVEGSLMERPRPGATSPVLIVDKLVRVLPHESCAPRFGNSPLLNTYWKLTHVGDRAVPPVTDLKREPSLTFAMAPGTVPNVMAGTYAGNTGCNRVVGTLQAQNASLTLTSGGTLVACRQGAADEAAFVAALKATRAYRITGHVLELLDDSGTRLVRFEAREPAGIRRSKKP